MGAEEHAAIVAGGGIAGLAAAVALAQAGWRVTVLERAAGFGEVGAGLGLTANGLAAAEALGLGDAVRAAGHRTVTAGFQDPAGRWVVHTQAPSDGHDTVTTLWGQHRQRLHAVLHQAATAAPGTELVTDAEVTEIRPGTPDRARAEVTWRSGASAHTPAQAHRAAAQVRTAPADLVVAADGVRSAVRIQLFPTVQPRYGGSTSWRAVIEDRAPDDQFTAVWGPAAEFGALPVSDHETYWYGYFRHPAGAVFPDELAAARERFAGWPPWVRDLLAATPADRLIRNDVYHLPQGPPAYTAGRVVLIGDAAHACLPTVGQGAAMALEDAVCVGRLIAAPVRAGAGLEGALATFDKNRRPRGQRTVRSAITVARLGADLGPGWRQTARNTVLRLVPARLMVRAGSSVIRWTPPPPPFPP
jgi:2-polyprenyl-6-methoxyphenol hydroxylase-like FAD-dependent oxidoreductase